MLERWLEIAAIVIGSAGALTYLFLMVIIVGHRRRRQLERHNWNVSRTAAAIGLHRQSLQEKLRELGITRPGRAATLE